MSARNREIHRHTIRRKKDANLAAQPEVQVAR
jgi:hypothetical protein